VHICNVSKYESKENMIAKVIRQTRSERQWLCLRLRKSWRAKFITPIVGIVVKNKESIVFFTLE